MKDTDVAKLSKITFVGTTFVPRSAEAENYLNSTEFTEVNGCFCVSNEQGLEMIENMGIGEEVLINQFKPRDLALHRAYMGFLNYVWEYMPEKFKKAVKKHLFYKWLKMFSGQYEVSYKFKNPVKKEDIFNWLKERKKEFRLTYKNIEKISDEWSKDEMRELTSISFSRMNDVEFKEYVKNQLPSIYSIVSTLYNEESAKDIIETIGRDWERFFDKLDKT